MTDTLLEDVIKKQIGTVPSLFLHVLVRKQTTCEHPQSGQATSFTEPSAQWKEQGRCLQMKYLRMITGH